MPTFRQTALQSGIHLSIVPAARLADFRAEIEHFAETQELNGFQKFIVGEYEFAPKEPTFEMRSVIVTATPHGSVGDAIFALGGKSYKMYYNNGIGSTATRDCVSAAVADAGYSLEHTGFWFPYKRFAVQAGLCEYGRNNITYLNNVILGSAEDGELGKAEIHGSYVAIDAYYSDMPADEDTWRGVVTASACEGCSVCESVCPTGAIREGVFLLDNVRCICAANEAPEPFPNFIPADAHHSIVGCMKCQYNCPLNATANARTYPTLSFTEAETERLLRGAPYDDLEPSLAERFNAAEMQFAGDLPRNLRVCFDIIDAGGTVSLS